MTANFFTFKFSGKLVTKNAAKGDACSDIGSNFKPCGVFNGKLQEKILGRWKSLQSLLLELVESQT